MNILFEGVFGSHLYGLNTPNSDVDVNGIYVPNIEQLLFNEYKDVLDCSDGVLDKNMFSIQKYYKMLCKADTVSIDMLHTPANATKKFSNLWLEMRKNRSCIYSKNMRGIIGYIKTQSAKYGHKVERLAEMQNYLEFLFNLKKFDLQKVKSHIDESSYKHISFIEERVENENKIVAAVDVCGSRYQVFTPLSLVIQSIQLKIARYGKRTTSGVKNKGDFKSLSHSYRVLSQLEEIIDTRDLVFPLKDRDFILEMKLGKFTSEDVSSMITDKYELVMQKLNNSDLPENSDISPIRNAILNTYL